MKTDDTIECIVCNVALDNLVYKDNEVHPMGGLHFRTYGHYGSTIFDPMGTGETLDVAICDLCIMKSLEKRVRGSGKKDLTDHYDMIYNHVLANATRKKE